VLIGVDPLRQVLLSLGGLVVIAALREHVDDLLLVDLHSCPSSLLGWWLPWFGQRFAGGGTREGDAWWKDMWDTYPTFRRSQRVITAVWAVVLLLEAVVKAIAIRLSDYQTGFVWDQILPVVAFVIALALTIWIAKRSQAEGMRRRDAARRESPTPM